jgi:glycosyltransferase involved in cell wall biosynthesis
LPVFNAVSFVHLAIDSVLEQTLKDFELIIIDDASDDGSGLIIDRYSGEHSFIRLFRNGQRQGVVRCLNKGLKHATGRKIARIDADDIWHPGKLAKQVTYMDNHPEVFLLGTFVRHIDESGNEIPGAALNRYTSDNDIRMNILKKNFICHSSVIYRREVMETVGFYNEAYINSEDYEYWIRILADHHVEIFPEVLTSYRIHSSMVSIKRRREQKRFAIRAKRFGIRKLKKRITWNYYLLNELWPLLVPGFVIRAKRKLLRRN